MPEMKNSSSNSPQNLDGRFVDVDELKLVMRKIHPDILGGSDEHGSPRYWAGELMKLLNALRSSEQIRSWPRELRDQMESGSFPEIRFVRKVGDHPAEVSDPVRIPRSPHPFLLALDVYTNGAEWSAVQTLLSRDPKIVSEHISSEFEERIRHIQDIPDAERVAKALNDTSMPERARDRITGRLSLMISKVFDRDAKSFTSFKDLAALKDSARDFFAAPYAQPLSLADTMITIDGAALDLAQAIMRKTKDRGELASRWAEIVTFPYSAAEHDLSLLAKEYDDRIQQLFIKNIKQKRSIASVEALRQEIQNFEFKHVESEGADRVAQLIKVLEDFVRVYGERWKTPQNRQF